MILVTIQAPYSEYGHLASELQGHTQGWIKKISLPLYPSWWVCIMTTTPEGRHVGTNPQIE